MKTFWQDILYGFRMLVKKPGFTVVAALSLALVSVFAGRRIHERILLD
jgi:hypothetical protein